ncbi:hypothetical protein [Levilinea saccharolytica]|uniref:STAS/SEC14 domain-containing protein n=1 Tax=Levilinea saccharolytica TaxID=229921 RepID=A0A0P6YRI2_9CHLR|nr:hypothetical protein [Levilinea saccharolytica]KPL85817.1 hypothetical protein ADN01_05755 [Levilinea saccharolytica]GAP16722.1 hypothetical protein LSAC_00578 [Levilinea saccharolytica]
MTIHYSFHMQSDYLLVKAWGADENLEEVKRYGEAVIQAAVQHNCPRILCDELELVYRLEVAETFFSAEHISKLVPSLHRVAIVTQASQLEVGKFWEDVAVNRGLYVRMYTSLEEAKNWLLS